MKGIIGKIIADGYERLIYLSLTSGQKTLVSTNPPKGAFTIKQV